MIMLHVDGSGDRDVSCTNCNQNKDMRSYTACAQQMVIGSRRFIGRYWLYCNPDTNGYTTMETESSPKRLPTL